MNRPLILTALCLCCAGPVAAHEGAKKPTEPAAAAQPAKPEASKEASKDAKAEGKPESDAKPPSSFASKPKVGAKATCPVSGDTFTIKKNTKMETYQGRVYPFCCADCISDFKKDPAKYAQK